MWPTVCPLSGKIHGKCSKNENFSVYYPKLFIRSFIMRHYFVRNGYEGHV